MYTSILDILKATQNLFWTNLCRNCVINFIKNVIKREICYFNGLSLVVSTVWNREKNISNSIFISGPSCMLAEIVSTDTYCFSLSLERTLNLNSYVYLRLSDGFGFKTIYYRSIGLNLIGLFSCGHLPTAYRIFSDGSETRLNIRKKH